MQEGRRRHRVAVRGLMGSARLRGSRGRTVTRSHILVSGCGTALRQAQGREPVERPPSPVNRQQNDALAASSMFTRSCRGGAMEGMCEHDSTSLAIRTEWASARSQTVPPGWMEEWMNGWLGSWTVVHQRHPIIQPSNHPKRRKAERGRNRYRPNNRGHARHV